MVNIFELGPATNLTLGEASRHKKKICPFRRFWKKKTIRQDNFNIYLIMSM